MDGIVIKTEPGMASKQKDDQGQGAKVKMENGLGVKAEEGEPNCGCDCFKENKLLREAILELGKGKALMEDFLQVEFGEKFATFVKKREHLISLGFGGEDAKPGQGKALLLPKSRDLTGTSDLVDLLMVTKDQAGPGKENVKPAQPQQTYNDETVKKASVPLPPPEGKTPAKKLQSPPPPSASGMKPNPICPICQAQVHRPTFTRHLLDLHLDQNRRVTCSDCRHQFNARWKLAAHLKTAHWMGEDQAEIDATRLMMNREVRRWLTEMRRKAKAPPVLPGEGE